MKVSIKIDSGTPFQISKMVSVYRNQKRLVRKPLFFMPCLTIQNGRANLKGKRSL